METDIEQKMLEHEMMDEFYAKRRRRVVALEEQVATLEAESQAQYQRIAMLEARGKALDQLIRSVELATFQR